MLFESQIKQYRDYTDRYLAFRIEFRKEVPYALKDLPYNTISVSAAKAAEAIAAFGKAMYNALRVGVFIMLFSETVHGQSLIRTIVQDDKFWHHQTSALLSGTGSIISFKIWEAPVRNVTFTVGSNIALGAGKEVWDGMGNGVMDWKGDFPMDIVGSVTGGFFAGMAITLKETREAKIDEEKYNLTLTPYDERVKAVETYKTTINPEDSGSEQK